MKTNFLLLFAFVLCLSCKQETITSVDTRPKDIDGNIYDTVKIGTQIWMKQNLKTTRYNDGTVIGEVEDSTAWANIYNNGSSTHTPAWCYYNADAANNVTYGKLYNFYAVNTGKLAPTGWHVPSDAEWTTLINYLGGEDVAGNKMKATTLWFLVSGIVNTNSSGFTALPAGIRSGYGVTYGKGEYASFWSSTDDGTFDAWARHLHSDDAHATKGFFAPGKECGFSVRCIRN